MPIISSLKLFLLSLFSFKATEWYKNTVNYWPFENVSNHISVDYTGPNDGNITGSYHSVSGIVGSALSLSGNQSYVDFGVLSSSCLNKPSTCKTGFTIVFWLKIPEFRGNRIVLQLGEHRYSRGFTVWTRKRLNRNVGFSVNTRLRKYVWLQEWNEDWNHIALIWDNRTSSLRISINCSTAQVVNTSEPAEPQSNDNKASRLILGASHAMKKNIQIMVDEFAIWDQPIYENTLCKIIKIHSVNGNYSEWSQFSACSVSCGNGLTKRTRTCTRPSPRDRGKDCSHLGAPEERKTCFLVPCPRHGNFSQWSVFSECSKSCGTGLKKRTRNCSNPEPKHGGRNCTSLGKAVEVSPCNTKPCPINGDYGPWSVFSECTVSCGNGTRKRARNCSNPYPRHGGQNCSLLGPSVETAFCNTNLCPIHGGFSEWTTFGDCTKSCANGTRTRARNCTNPQPNHGGRDCSSLGSSVDIQQCNVKNCPINGGYTEWTEFSKCTKSCGNGTQKRARNCSNPEPQYDGANCSSLGRPLEIQQCNTHHCPIDGGYSQWTKFTACSSTCGLGNKTRWRNCSNPQPQYGGRNCSHLGDPVQVEVCVFRHCPVHGGFTEWTEFSRCSKSCEVGLKNRTRYCTNPQPQHGGKYCSGEQIEFELCNLFRCPINGGYTEWSQFSECSKTCEAGTRKRTRKCNNPAPNFGGKNCLFLGPAEEKRACNVFPCPVHGNYSSWSNFSACSKSCGNGTTQRHRNCSNPEPKHGGKNCSLLGPSIEVKNCTNFPCPIDGNFSAWTIFSVCSKSCGNGTKTRTRNCSNPFPKHGGRNCSLLGSSEEVISCNAFPCPIHGNYTSWSNFSSCSKSCGNGTKSRTRSCENPKPQHNGTNCTLLGLSIDVKRCNVFPCPINGGYTQWAKFTHCSHSCGNGTKYSVRNCTNPTPLHGGKDCSRIGPAIRIRTCNERPCSIDGFYSEWSEFSFCSRSCAGGIQNRSRLCDNPSPKYGGMNCSRLGPASEVKTCNSFPCPIHGNYSEWSGFQSCDRTCGGGRRTRQRNCTNPPPAYGGRNCSDLGPSTDFEVCNAQDCPDIVFAVAVNLTSGKWNPRRKESLIWKIKLGVDEIMGYKINYTFSNFVFKKGSVITEFTLFLSHRDYQGITKLQDAIYVERKIDDLQVSPVNLTSPDVPTMAPIKITASNISSTTILLQWQTIPLNFSNGGILEYRITYIEVEGNDRKVKQKGLWEKIVDGQKTMAHVTGLKKFTQYQFRMAGVNQRGVGVDSMPITASTDQDTPSKPPSTVKAFNRTSTSVLVEWSPIPQNSTHGILLGYHIHFKTVNPVGFSDVSPDIQSAGASNISSLIQRLLKFTEYTIQVSGYTVKGDGPFSKAVIVRTDEDVPSKPPPNVNAHNLTSTSIQVHWDAIPPRYIHGNLLGYKVSFIATFRGNAQRWNETSVNQSTTTAVITNLRKYTKYMVAVEGFTSKGNGIESKSVPVTTAEDVPDAYPTNVSGFNKSSTSLFVEWQHIPQQNKNGVLKGYKITYAPIQYQPSQSITVESSRSSTTLENLKKYTWYQIRVAGFTSKGLGPYPPKQLELRTSEDVPSRSAISVHARNTSHTSLLVEWNQIPAKYIHGVLLGYRVLFWRYNESRDTYETRQTGPDVHSVRLTDLWIYTKYKIQVLGFTVAGEGRISKEIEVSTDEFIPSQAPINVLALNKTSPTKIIVRWKPIPDKFYVHGILRGYRVFYKAIATANKKFDDEVIQTRKVTVDSSTLAAVLENLTAFTRYEIKVVAFTIKGDGVPSNAIRADTCNCHYTIFTNWWINPPYSDIEGSNKSGIITPILKQAVHACCGNCTEHGNTRIDFQRSGTDQPALNSGLLEFKKNIEQTTELHFPVYGTMDQTRFSGSYGFVPFVQSPGIALIIIGDEKGSAAKLLIKSLAICFPILFLSVAMLWVSSLILWFVETGYNQGHFPQSVLQGSWEAIWWAFASMTTLGYGDRIPKTLFGRLICFSWILTGLVMITCFNSIMTTLLTARILDKDVMLYGTKIAAIQNSSSYRLAIRKNARVNPNGKEYANLKEVYEALQSREVKGMLIDAFTVGSKKELFNRRDLRISKLLDYSSAYGVALGGEAKKLQKCFQEFVSEQRSEISRILQNNVDTIEVSKKSLTVERSRSLFDPSFPTYVNTVIICAVILGVMLLVGAKFELVKKMGWIKLRRKGKEDQMLPRRLELMRNTAELKSEMSTIVAMFRINCLRRINALKQKHKRELLNLAKLKRHTESEVIQKGSFRRDTLFQRSLGGTRRQEHNSNGHTKQASTRTKLLADGMETIV